MPVDFIARSVYEFAGFPATKQTKHPGTSLTTRGTSGGDQDMTPGPRVVFSGFGWVFYCALFCGGTTLAGGLTNIHTVFLIVMENANWSALRGSSSAPYINDTLLPMSSFCEQYYTPPGLPGSLPNYLWLEAGTNFGVLDSSDPSAHSFNSTDHLVTLLVNGGISWKSYQENISGANCPVSSTGLYA